MAISKEVLKSVTQSEGDFSIPKGEMNAKEISSFRSRLWQMAKRNGMKVTCSISGNEFKIKTTRV